MYLSTLRDRRDDIEASPLNPAPTHEMIRFCSNLSIYITARFRTLEKFLALGTLGTLNTLGTGQPSHGFFDALSSEGPVAQHAQQSRQGHGEEAWSERKLDELLPGLLQHVFVHVCSCIRTRVRVSP